jgi:endogenous inhibitor of DNA gyrase (YacG/DUF329 family)
MTRTPTPEEKHVAIGSFEWPSTPGGQKVKCPECGQTGYPGGSWTWKHAHHTTCPDCHRPVTERGLEAHQRKHRKGTP